MVGRSSRSLLQGGGGVRGDISRTFLWVGGVKGGVDTKPNGRRPSCGEGRKGSASPSKEFKEAQSRDGTVDTETERGAQGPEGVMWLAGFGL